MTADPKPDQPVRYLDREGTIVSADAGRPEPAYLLEVKCGMTWIVLQGAYA